MAKIFVSYSRKDIEFAKRLTAELTKSELDYWIDWEGIPPTVDWWREIEKGIEEADVFLFLISPDSAKSKICGQEIDTAVKNGKRIIPIVVREIEWEDTPPQLGHLNYIFFSRNDDFDTAVKKLMTAIQTDYEWAATHRRLQVKALDWERNNKENGFLLRGKDLNDAENELAHNTSKEPHPTDLQREYVFESRKATDRQRRTITSVSIVGVIALALLAVFGFYQAGQATNNFNIASTAQINSDNNAATAVANEQLAIKNEQLAIQNEQEALRQADISKVGELAAQANSQRDKDFQVSLLLGVEAYEGTEAIPDFESIEAKNALLSNAIVNPQIKIYLNGHTDRVDGVAFNSDGAILATGSWDKTVILWNTDTGEQIGGPLEHSEPVNKTAFHPFNKTLLVTIGREKITFWDISTHQKLSEQPTGHTALISGLVFSNDGQLLASGSLDNTVILRDGTTGEQLGEPLHGISTTIVDGISSIAFDSNSKILAAGGNFGDIYIWDLHTRQMIHHILRGVIGNTSTGHTSSVSGLEFFNAADNTLPLISSGYDGSIIFWDANTGQQLSQRLYEHTDAITSLDMESQTLASVSFDNTIVLWDYFSRQIKNKPTIMGSGDGGLVDTALTGEPLHGHSNPIYSVAVTFSPVTPESLLMASGDGGGTVILWDVYKASQIGRATISNESDSFRLGLHAGNVNSVAFSPDGQTAFSGGDRNESMLWDVPSAQKIGETLSVSSDWEQQIDVIGSKISSVATSPDGTVLAASRTDRYSYFTHLISTGTVLPPGTQIKDDTILNSTIVLWDKDTLQPIGELANERESINNDEEVYQAEITSIVFSPNGKTLAASRNDTSVDRSDPSVIVSDLKGLVIFWDMETLQLDGEPLRHDDFLTSVAFSPDGKIVAAGSEDNTIILWDVSTRQQIGAPLTGHKDVVNSVAFSPDGKTLASGSKDNTVILWDVAARQQIGQPLTGHTTWVNTVAFSPDGNILASGSNNGIVILWNAATHLPFSQSITSGVNVLGLAISSDGKKLVTGGASGIALWDLNPETWLAQSCERAGRNFTVNEWNIYFPNEEYRKTCDQWPLETDPKVTPTLLPAATPMPSPTATPVSQSTSLAGTISLVGDMVEPFVSSIELRHEVTGFLINWIDTDSDGKYKMDDVDSGAYQLWVLITKQAEMVAGCTDVSLPDGNWELWYPIIKDNTDESKEFRASSTGIPGSGLSKALEFLQYLQLQPGEKIKGYYAVLKDFIIEPTIENKLDITLICK